MRSPAVLDKVFHEELSEVSRTHYGPSMSHPCLCGSRLPAGGCHGTLQGQWLGPPLPPRITGPRTGYSHPRCFGRFSHDCSSKITAEHWLTQDIQRSILREQSQLAISGTPWSPTGPKLVGSGALHSKILCSRHNNSLSSLDNHASALFTNVVSDQVDASMRVSTHAIPTGFTLANGELLQLWMLKFVWGALASGSILIDGVVQDMFRLGVTREMLADILWRGRAWPAGWGLYMASEIPYESTTITSVALRTETDGTGVRAASARFGSISFSIEFGYNSNQIFRPGGFVLKRSGIDGYRMTVLAWPNLGHQLMTFENTGYSLSPRY